MQLKIKLIMSDRILVKAKLHSEQIKKKDATARRVTSILFQNSILQKEKKIVNFKLMV